MNRFIIAILLGFAASAQASGLKLGAEAALGYDSNVANARQGGDEHEAGFVELGGSAEQTWDLNDDNALQGRFGIDAQTVSRYEGLDNAKGSLQLRYLLRPGQAFYTPTLALTGSAAWWEFNSRLRDSADYRASAYVREQITTRISARLTGALDWRESRSEVFDLATHSLGLDLDWALTNRLAVYAGFQRRWGNFVTTRPEAAGYPAEIVYEDDDVFADSVALRLSGAADIATAGCNFAFTPQLSLDLQGTFVETGATTGLHYRRIQSVASLLARF